MENSSKKSSCFTFSQSFLAMTPSCLSESSVLCSGYKGMSFLHTAIGYCGELGGKSKWDGTWSVAFLTADGPLQLPGGTALWLLGVCRKQQERSPASPRLCWSEEAGVTRFSPFWEIWNIWRNKKPAHILVEWGFFCLFCLLWFCFFFFFFFHPLSSLCCFSSLLSILLLRAVCWEPAIWTLSCCSCTDCSNKK